MNSMHGTNQVGGRELLKASLPLMTLAILLAMSSAAKCFGGSATEPGAGVLLKRVVASGHLMGTLELQKVVTWRTKDSAHLAIESVGRNPRTLWQIDDAVPASEIDSVQVVDLDGDSIPEILGLWRVRGSGEAMLRGVHWDRRSQGFAELNFREDGKEPEIRSYRLRGNVGHRRIVVYGRNNFANGEFELRGSEFVRVGGGNGVTTHDESGIEGKAVISPVRPGPVREGQPDSAPFKTTLVISRASDGHEVTRVETGSDGRFRVKVPPGTYNVGPLEGTGRRLPRAGQETVTVVSGQFAQVTINFDSGIR